MDRERAGEVLTAQAPRITNIAEKRRIDANTFQSQNRSEKRQKLLKSPIHRFLLASIVLLPLILTACSPSSGANPNGSNSGVVIQSPVPTEAPATATNTPIPTPTATEVVVGRTYIQAQIEEVHAWWDQVVAEAKSATGCAVDREIVNVVETGIVNSIPWTIDQNGQVVEGIIPILCGTGAYLTFGDLATSVLPSYVEEKRARFRTTFPVAIGPTHMMREYKGFTFANEFLGGLSTGGAERLREFHLCLSSNPEKWPFIATLVVDADPRLAEALAGGYDDFSGAIRLQECLP